MSDPTATRGLPARPPLAARRVGYGVSVLLNTALLWLLNERPGWEAVPFLTSGTATVLGVVNASVAAAALVNLVDMVADPPWSTALGDVLVNVVGLVALVALWRTFPFAFDPSPVDWATVARVALGVSIGGTVIGAGVGSVRLVRSLTPPRHGVRPAAPHGP
ncbi:hypothetical protein [Cellulomonas cellasea]|uniref:Uncharacterized protein n=1 Tax=Cellulomonas cellasea TaxID=43670 RepID=A0A7W4UCM2_9CELL|nr:hypothetical protein [Cellulomonas cellasea]MBB2921674.1 hypothetical protein [Cellulomonas cellasea]